MKETHYIYRITHLPTGRFYIGKRSCNGPWQEDRYMGSGTYLKRLLKKYPAEEFKKEVLCFCRDAAQALYAERAAIGTQWRDNPLCINLREGGEGVVDFWDVPENREALSLTQKKRYEDPELREANAERSRKRWEDPKLRQAASSRQKKRLADPVRRAAYSAVKVKRTVRLSKDGIIYAINKELLAAELGAGAEFVGNMTAIHHPAEGVWTNTASSTAKHLLLLDVGWEFGRRSLLEQIGMKHVDKATGKVLPRS